ncbi:MAG: hypothetical protein KatS3mg131_1167 [Candidatus Tectimicrobiota bacterium]|nr:MAG: hypothetical protein KatS3mg131_1167 [Candidatus Tectomicrobia bacterium]
MEQPSFSLWAWVHQTFGPVGAVVVLVLAFLLVLSWGGTPLWLWRLHRRVSLAERLLAEVQERLAALNRQQQVTRLQRDKERKKPRRR